MTEPPGGRWDRRSDPRHPPEPDPALEQLLRDALHAEAETVTPAGDGLVRIRERTRSGRSRRHWVRSALVTAAAAAAAVTVAVVPNVFHHRTGQQQATAPGRQGQSSAASSMAARTAGPAEPVVWPYASVGAARSRAAADIRSGRLAALTDPAAAARSFLASTVGPGDYSVAKPAAAGRLTTVVVAQNSSTVARVTLRRVLEGPPPAWVVVSADAPGGSLSIASVMPANPDSVTVSGTTTAGSSTRLKVKLLTGGSSQSVGVGTTAPSPAGGPFTVRANLTGGAAPSAVVLWSVDVNGNVTAVTARPLVNGSLTAH